MVQESDMVPVSEKSTTNRTVLPNNPNDKIKQSRFDDKAIKNKRAFYQPSPNHQYNLRKRMPQTFMHKMPLCSKAWL